MLFAEALGADTFRQRVKIYATDVDEDALGKARSGAYTLNEIESVPDELRRKYFDESGTRFNFRNDFRRSLIFGRHDLVQDAPISRIDLLVCRNTLMYFTPEIQNRVLLRLHYALNPDGFLFLGKAEMLLTHQDLFRAVEMRERLFIRVPTDTARDRQAALRDAAELTAALPSPPRELVELAADASPIAQVVVDAAGTMVHANSTARNWFGLAQGDLGKPLQDLELSYRPLELRSLIERAHGENQTVVIENVERPVPGKESMFLDVAVVPLGDGKDSRGTGVLFTDVSRFHDLRSELERSRHDLETAYEELQSTNEELETTNEELQSTIEELETTNEELQSSNEELETMNEELESTNAELQKRTFEADSVNSFMNSVISSLELGVVVIDRSLRVQMWNSRSEDLWGVRSDEAVGQALTNLDIGLPVAETLDLVRRTLSDSGAPGELTMEAVNRRGRSIRCRIVSNRLSLLDGSGDGVVLLMEQLKDSK
jgi:two-component system CheB/CheR fusion protein